MVWSSLVTCWNTKKNSTPCLSLHSMQFTLWKHTYVLTCMHFTASACQRPACTGYMGSCARQDMQSHRYKCRHSYVNASWVPWSQWPHFSFSPSEHIQLLIQCLELWGEARGRNVITCRCAERHWHRSSSYSFNQTNNVLVHLWQTDMSITEIWVTFYGTKAFVLCAKTKVGVMRERDKVRKSSQNLWDGVFPFPRFSWCYRITD